jgi:aminopeptidase
MATNYTPPQKILEKYADVLVNFALGGGKGIKKGDVVRVVCPESAKPLYIELLRAVIKAGGHVVGVYLPSSDQNYNVEKDFFGLADEHQLKFFPKRYFRGLIDDIDHQIGILSTTDPHALKGVDPKKMMMAGEARKSVREWMNEKENKGKFSWTLALYGTPGEAKEAGMSLKSYWKEIINACYLDKKDPIKEWGRAVKEIDRVTKKLTGLKIDRLHVEGKDADLWVKIGEKRKWLGGRGANIPSFEVFTSPDWRGTEGWIRFSEPLYRYGNLIKGIKLEFKNGRVVKSSAKTGEKVLKEMIATKNADKVGEFSLTDGRLSRITKFMAETLYDENVGGKFGNTHIALGSAYEEGYDGNLTKMKKKDWEKFGFNKSSVHTDIVSTTDRTVTAYLSNGKEKIIYKNGRFTI